MDDSQDNVNLPVLIRSRREAAGMTQDDLADMVGTKQQTIQKIENNITKKSSFLPQILKLLKIDLEYITKPKGSATKVTKLSVVEPVETILQGPPTLPVHGAAQGGKGAVIVSTDPIEYVARPQPLLSVRDGYGIIIVEDSMAPEFEPGQIALVHPHLPPQPGNTCIFYMQQSDGTALAVIKRLRRVTADAWLVRQWNPPDGDKQDFSLKRVEWQTCHVTVGRYDSRR